MSAYISHEWHSTRALYFYGKDVVVQRFARGGKLSPRAYMCVTEYHPGKDTEIEAKYAMNFQPDEIDQLINVLVAAGLVERKQP